MMTEIIRLHHILEHSLVNGPGSRFVIWTQGCPLNCVGCFNQSTHDVRSGFDVNIIQLAKRINQTLDIRGVTLSGGEPFLQIDAINKLLNYVNKELDILLFSGYTFEEIRKDESKMKVLYQVDAALLGRYKQNLPHPFYGKKLVLNGMRIKKDELKPWINTEMIFNSNKVSITGLY